MFVYFFPFLFLSCRKCHRNVNEMLIKHHKVRKSTSSALCREVTPPRAPALRPQGVHIQRIKQVGSIGALIKENVTPSHWEVHQSPTWACCEFVPVACSPAEMSPQGLKIPFYVSVCMCLSATCPGHFGGSAKSKEVHVGQQMQPSVSFAGSLLGTWLRDSYGLFIYFFLPPGWFVLSPSCTASYNEKEFES